jgi:hypothetical protein
MPVRPKSDSILSQHGCDKNSGQMCSTSTYTHRPSRLVLAANRCCRAITASFSRLPASPALQTRSPRLVLCRARPILLRFSSVSPSLCHRTLKPLLGFISARWMVVTIGPASFFQKFIANGITGRARLYHTLTRGSPDIVLSNHLTRPR